jgi:Fic family protein
MYNKEKPYNNLPKLPPNADIETKNILKAALLATRALAELKTRGNLLPNQSLIIDSLVLLEAKSSSEIENIFTTHDKLYQADILDNNSDPHTKEVRKYKEALWHGISLIKNRPLSTNTFIEVMRAIKENDSGIRKTIGTKIAFSSGQLIYTPPEGYDVIVSLLNNLDEYIHANDNIEPLIKMAVIHYQFEAIHPFADGNGRTGRIINILYLIQEKLLDAPILFLSNYIIKNKTAYYQGLQNVTENNDWENWIVYILNAVEKVAYETITLIDEIRQAMKDFQVIIEDKAKTIYSKDLLEVLFEQPYCTISALVERNIVRRAAASRYLKKLEEIGLLLSVKVGNNLIYLNPRLMNILSKA